MGTNIDTDGEFTGACDAHGSLIGFELSPFGKLTEIPGSLRDLGYRPASLQFTPDGKHLVIANFNAGCDALGMGRDDGVSVFSVDEESDSYISTEITGAGASTLPGNPEGRNLANPIGLATVEDGGYNYVVVTEPREFGPDGTGSLQTGSVSTWRILDSGALVPINLDVRIGSDELTGGERTACWLQFTADHNHFFVTNTIDSTISSFRFQAGQIEVVDTVVYQGNPPTEDDPLGTTDGFIDLSISDDGRYIYVLYGLVGQIGVFEVNGSSLTLVEEIGDGLPTNNIQGIVSF